MATERICAVCKKDCSGSERVKDKKGRYFHKPCYERAKKAVLAKQRRVAATGAQPRRAPTAAPVAAPAMADCPNCNMTLPPGAVICTTCGYNRQTGEMTPVLRSVKFDHSPPKKESRGVKLSLPSGSFGALVKNPLVIGVCVTGFFGILFLVGLGSVKATGVYYLAMLGFSLIVGIWLLVDAFQEGAMHGVLCLVCGPYSIYYVFGVSSSQNLKIAYVLNILIVLGFFGLVGSMDPSAILDPAMFEGAEGFDNVNFNANGL